MFRTKNESLEKVAVEKESMFNDIKIESDKISSKYYKLEKVYDDIKSQKELLEQKLKRFDE